MNSTGNVFARPTYYGMLTFSAIMGGSNSSIYKPQVNLYGTNTRLKAWAVYNAQTKTHTFIVIHKDVGEPFSVAINSPNTADGVTAQVLELTSAKLTDLTGFTLGGVSFPNFVASDYKEKSITALNSLFTLTCKTGTATIIRVDSAANALPILSFV